MAVTKALLFVTTTPGKDVSGLRCQWTRVISNPPKNRFGKIAAPSHIRKTSIRRPTVSKKQPILRQVNVLSGIIGKSARLREFSNANALNGRKEANARSVKYAERAMTTVMAANKD